MFCGKRLTGQTVCGNVLDSYNNLLIELNLNTVQLDYRIYSNQL